MNNLWGRRLSVAALSVFLVIGCAGEVSVDDCPAGQVKEGSTCVPAPDDGTSMDGAADGQVIDDTGASDTSGGEDTAVADTSTPDVPVKPVEFTGVVFDDDYGAYVSVADFAGANNAITIDKEVKYDGDAALKIEVPTSGYTGAAMVLDGPASLADYVAVTFWAKASEAKAVNVFGVGNDSNNTTFEAEWSQVALTTEWKKYTIPLPLAAKLGAERGVFHFAEGSEDGAYTIWVDEIRYDASSNVGTPKPTLAETDLKLQVGATGKFGPAQATYTIDGAEQTLKISSNYYTFTSSDEKVATVVDGQIKAVGTGSATISAKLGDTDVAGKVSVEVIDASEPKTAAPKPTQKAADVVSLFSDAYKNINVDTWSADWDQADVADVKVAGDNTKKYSNLTFAGVVFEKEAVDASKMSHIHIDFWTADSKDFKVKLVDFGADGKYQGGDDSESEVTIDANSTPAMANGKWVSADLPLSAFSGLKGKTNVTQMVLSASNATVYIDNVYFYSGGTEPPPPAEPKTAAPTPTQKATEVISLFSDAYKDITVDTWSATWDQADVADFKIGSDNVKKYSNMQFAGVVFETAMVDASKMTHLHVDIWSPNSKSFKIKLVDFGTDGKYQGGDDSEHEVTIDGSSTPKMENGKWVSLDLPLKDFTGLKGTSSLAQMVLSATNAIVYVDNLYFYGGTAPPPADCGNQKVEGKEECDDGNKDDTDACLSTCKKASCGDGKVQKGVEVCDDGNTKDGDTCSADCKKITQEPKPAAAAPTPTQKADKVISLFSDAYTDNKVDTWSATWDQADLAEVKIGADNVKKYTDMVFAGVVFEAQKVDASKMTHFHMDVWSADATNFKIKLVDFGKDAKYQGGDDSEHEMEFSDKTTPKFEKGKWVSIDVALNKFTGLKGVSALSQMVLSSSKATVYVDNVYFYDDGKAPPPPPPPAEPKTPAPTPTKKAANVISLFSDAYTDSKVDNWSAAWDQANVSDVKVGTDNVKKYTQMVFAGIVFETAKVDASKMTHFHMDIWSPDATNFKIKLVDFGKDAKYQGGDDSEHELTFDGASTPKIETEKWISIDVPLKSFTNLKGVSALAQMVLSSSKSTVYIDNIYFYGDGSQPPAPKCGDKKVEGSEECDDGNTDDTDACVSCKKAKCGDGKIHKGVEVCDDGNAKDGDKCSADCKKITTVPTPQAPAPAPTKAAGEVISLFSDVYVDNKVDTWSAAWDQADVTELKFGSDSVKKYTNMVFAGVVFEAQKVDASKMTHIHMDLWSPDATNFKIKLVDFGKDAKYQGGDDSEHEVTLNATSTPKLETKKWVGVDVPLKSFTGLKGVSALAQMVLSSSKATVYVDNVYFYSDGNQPPPPPAEPKSAAPAPGYAPADVISLFSDLYTDVVVDTWSAQWDQADEAEVKVDGNATKKYTNLTFAGVVFETKKINADKMSHLRMDVWTPDATVLKVKLVDFGKDGKYQGGDDSEHELSFNASSSPKLETGKWVTLDIPLKNFSGLKGISNLAQMVISSSKSTVYIDNVLFHSDGGSQPPPLKQPAAPAASPTKAPADVISLFSDAYTNVKVDTWSAPWDKADVVEGVIGTDKHQKYTNLEYAGVVFETKTIDASKMTHLYMDIWSPDATTFKVKLVDFGKDGKYQGGDDSEHEVTLTASTTPKLEQGKWVSVTIPLKNFTGLKGTTNLAQMVISSTKSTVFVDNVLFYNDGGSQPPVAGAPTAPPPAPTAAPKDVIALYSNTYQNLHPVDSWSAPWDSADVEDAKAGKEDVKKYTKLVFAGVVFDKQVINATKMTHIHMDVWTPDATNFKVKLVDFGTDGKYQGGDDSEHELAFDATSTPKLSNGTWVAIDVPLKEFAGLKGTSALAQIVLSSSNATVFLDNVYFYVKGADETGEPQSPPPVPTQAPADVISLFSDSYTNVKVDTWSADWDKADLQMKSFGPMNLLLYTNMEFAGAVFQTQQVNASTMTHLHMDIWTPNATVFKIKLVDFGKNGAFQGGDDSESEVTFNATSTPALKKGSWQSFDIPLTEFNKLNGMANLAQMVMSSSKAKVYVDNVFFYKSGGGGQGPGGNTPPQPAPKPSIPAQDVISLFSDAYTDVPVDTWSAQWDNADVSDVKVGGDSVKKYTKLAFAGVVFETKTIDASNMTKLHLDVWSADASELKVKLVDFGQDGKYGGGDDSEHEFIFDGASQPQLVKGQWIGLDLQLSAMIGLKSTKALAQMVISSNQSTVFIDNVYFHKSGGGGGGSNATPSGPAPASTVQPSKVKALFSNMYPISVTVDTWSAQWDNADVSDVKVGVEDTKKYSKLVLAGIEFTKQPFNATQMTHLHIDVWTPDATFLKVKLVDFGADGKYQGGDDSEHELTFNPGTKPKLLNGVWVQMDIPLKDFTGLKGKTALAQMLLGSSGGNVYIDNVFFYNGTTEAESGPKQPAPAPTLAESKVISLFSDTYTNQKVDTFAASWSKTSFQPKNYGPHKMLLYTNLSFAGIVFESQKVNATKMTHLHIDVWTDNASSLKVKLVDFGKDGKYLGGDDSEAEVGFTSSSSPPLFKNGWVSLEIPLSKFNTLNGMASLAQMVLSSDGGTVWVDNIYFHN